MAAPFVMWVWRGLLLQNMDAEPPVRPVEMVPQSASSSGRPWEGSLALDSCIGEDDPIYLDLGRGGVMLAHRDPVTVDLLICYM